MDKPRSSSGGVRNLRAMFEQNNKDEPSDSPPDRGRSPAGSMGGGSNGTSPRPLSKVRTSFVTVERSGQLGLQLGLRKESTGDGSMAKRRESFSVDEETDPQAISEKRQSIASEYVARKNSTAITETIPEFAIATPPIGAENRLGHKAAKIVQDTAPAASRPSVNPDKKTSVEDPDAKLLPVDPTSKAAVTGGAALKGSGGETLNGHTSGKLHTSAGTKTGDKTATSRISSKPTPITTAHTSTSTKHAPKSTKSPATTKSTVKTPTSGKSPSAAVHSSKANTQSKAQSHTADMKTNKSSPSASTAHKTAARPTTSSSTATTATKKTTTSSIGGFVKPRPKSPTKPIKLPASMTAPTASSLSKVAGGSDTTGRTSLGAPSTTTAARSPSRTSLAAGELRRKPSTIRHERPSLGPPPVKKQPSRQSLARSTTPADEGFLARMMRPTQSSSSKTHEKVVSPPRSRPATRPTTRDGSGHHHKPHEVLKGSPVAKKTSVLASHPKIEQPQFEKTDVAKSNETMVEEPIVEDEPKPWVVTEKSEGAAPEALPGKDVQLTEQDSHSGPTEDVGSNKGATVPNETVNTEIHKESETESKALTTNGAAESTIRDSETASKGAQKVEDERIPKDEAPAKQTGEETKGVPAEKDASDDTAKKAEEVVPVEVSEKSSVVGSKGESGEKSAAAGNEPIEAIKDVEAAKEGETA